MYSVQQQDFIGQWIEIYRAQMFNDAERFRSGIAGSTAKPVTRIIRM